MLASIIYLSLLLVLTGLGSFFLWKNLNRLVPVILLITTGIVFIGVSFLSITVNVNFFLGIFLVIIMIWITFLAITTIPSLENILCSAVVALFIGCVLLIPSAIVNVCTDYEHTIYFKYAITIEDGQIDVDLDYENIQNDVFDLLSDKIAVMKEAGENQSEGVIKIEYRCNYPLLLNNHDEKCSCTNGKICDVCEKYISSVSVKIY